MWPAALGSRPLRAMSIGCFVSMAEAIEWNCCGLSLRETGTKKDNNLYEGKKRLISCLDFLFVLFLYINLHLLQTKRGYKNEQKSVYILLCTITTITTITTPTPPPPLPPEWTMIWTKWNQTLSCVFVSFLLMICLASSKTTPPHPLCFYNVHKLIQTTV